MTKGRARDERRKHLRFPLGLPVIIHVEGRGESLTVEIVDIAMKGVRFRAHTEALAVGQRVSFAFVTEGEKTCNATGRIVRVDGQGEFVLSLEGANPEFDSFIGGLAP